MIKIPYDAYGSYRQFSAYILNPVREAICTINGVTQFDVTLNLNDVSQIQFTVQRWITDYSNHTSVNENPAYKYLHGFCQINIPELGELGYFIINTEPTINAQGTRNESKSFTAESYESVLQYQNLVDFYINQGTEMSLEMMAPGNLDAFGIPIENIKLVNYSNEDLSLMHLVLHDDWFGWEIGHIDSTIANLERSFEVSSQNVYSFIRNDICSAFRCVATFSLYTDELGVFHKAINLYDIETFGKNTNIYLSFRHFVDQMNIAPITDHMYTVFNVAGDSNLGIEAVNFGSNLIWDIDYPMSMCDETLQNKYAYYKAYRESKREAYADLGKDYAELQDQEASILDRVPLDLVTNNWSSTVYYTDEELQTVLANAQTIVDQLEEEYVPITSIDVTPDAALYHSYKDVIIPDVTNEIEYRAHGTPYEPVDYTVNWELYGLNELQNKLTQYQRDVDNLAELGYDHDVTVTQGQDWSVTHHAQYLRYQQYQTYISELQGKIATKTAQVEDIRQQMEAINVQRKAIADSVSLENYVTNTISTDGELTLTNGSGSVEGSDLITSGTVENGELQITHGFTPEEIAKISELFRVSDFSDSNYLVTDIDDTVSTINKQMELFTAAQERLAIESRPQLDWTVNVEDLFAIKEFNILRDDLQLGDFVIVHYDVDSTVHREPINSEDEGIIYTEGDVDPFHMEEPERRFAVEADARMRIISITFSGLKTDNRFDIDFSTKSITDVRNDDFESMLGNIASSSSNSISQGSSGSASSSGSGAGSLIRPTIEANTASFKQANIQSLNVTSQLDASTADIDSLSTDALTATDATITNLTATEAEVDTISADIIYLDGRALDSERYATDMIIKSLAYIGGVDDSYPPRYNVWDEEAVYLLDDIAIQGGRIYKALRNVPAGMSVLNTDYWEDITKTDMNAIYEAIRAKTF